MNIGLCTTITNKSRLPFEKRNIVTAAERRGHTVVLVDPQDCIYTLERGAQKPVVMLGDQNLATGLDALFVYGTSGRLTSTHLLVECLALAGVNARHLYDMRRGETPFGSKTGSTVHRWKHGVGTTTHFAFTLPNAERLLAGLEYPIVIKPVGGRHADGVKKFMHQEPAVEHARSVFATLEHDTPIMVQKRMRFAHEYRVLTLGENVIAVAEKHKQDRHFIGVSHYTIVAKPDRAMISIVLMASSGRFVGYDVGVTRNGDIHIIEANQSPNWETSMFKSGGPDVGDYLVQALERND